jgi:apolipoprotein D and lipocalin family protein
MRKLVFAFMLSFVACASSTDAPLNTVDYVNLDRYIGTWYEIARFDQKFQKNCTASKAEYSLDKRGDIKVVNSCRLYHPDGELKEAIGRAWVKDKKTNAKLKVQFFLRRFRLPFFAGNYWILDLDKDYKHVIVGDPSRKYLWILNREKEMDEETYSSLVNKAEAMGFDTSKLLRFAQ